MSVPNKNNTSEQAMTWFIKVREVVYGPYTLERLEKFSQEGRLSAKTYVSDNRDSGFSPAGNSAELFSLFQTSAVTRTTPGATIQDPGYKKKHFAICGQLNPALVSTFTNDLQQIGQTIHPVPFVWIVKAKTSTGELRNVISRNMGSEDSMIIFEFEGNDTAWFNIGQQADRSIREFFEK